MLANPSNISLLEYDDNMMTADAVGDGGKFTFMRAEVSTFEREGNTWKVPDAEFDTFKELALARLSTVLDVAGQSPTLTSTSTDPTITSSSPVAQLACWIGMLTGRSASALLSLRSKLTASSSRCSAQARTRSCCAEAAQTTACI